MRRSLDVARKKKRRTPKKSGGVERRMYTELNCRKCGQIIFDKADVADLVRSSGLSKSEVDCPHCCFRWGLVVVSDCTGWLACLVPPEGVADFYQAFNEALSIGASVNIISAILDRLIARAEVKK